MNRVSIEQAETALRALLAYVKTNGEEIVLTEGGRPIARLAPLPEPSEAETIEGCANGTSAGPDFARGQARRRLQLAGNGDGAAQSPFARRVPKAIAPSAADAAQGRS